jgi:5'(3')-deoxyribonucleotidase
MSKYRVMMDMDGVLYPFEEAFNQLYVKYGGEPIAFDHWLDFSALPGGIVEKVWNDPDLFRINKPYPGTQQAMKELDDMADVEVYYVTSFGRNPDITVPSKWLWLKRYFPWVSERNFAAICVKWFFRADLLVEDFPSNIKKWKKENPEGKAMLVQQPWNEDRVDEMLELGVYISPPGIGVNGLNKFIETVRRK